MYYKIKTDKQNRCFWFNLMVETDQVFEPFPSELFPEDFPVYEPLLHENIDDILI